MKYYLPSEFELVVLDESNIFDFIDLEFYKDKIILLKDKLFGYYDYIKALVLYCNGGLFLDVDTIVTEKFVVPLSFLKSTNLVAYSDGVGNICCGYLLANKHSFVLEELIRRYQMEYYLLKNKLQAQRLRNFIFNDVIRYFDKSEVLLLDAEKEGYLVEKALFGVSSRYLYRDFYFSNKYSLDDFFSRSSGVSALRNSVTPREFKLMNEKDFLKQDILLAKLFV